MIIGSIRLDSASTASSTSCSKKSERPCRTWSRAPDSLADGDHLRNHVGEQVGVLHGGGQAGAGGYLALNLPVAIFVNVVSCSAADRVSDSTSGTPARTWSIACVSSGQ